jgi:hypothetical protein
MPPRNSNRRAVAVLALLCLVSVGCEAPPVTEVAPQLAEAPVGRTPSIDLTLKALDNEVITAVLRDLLLYAGDDSPVTTRCLPPAGLLFDARPVRPAQADPAWALTADDILYRHNPDWERLTPAQLAASCEAAEHLAARVEVGDGSATFRVQDQRIGIHEPPADGAKRSLRAPRPLRAWVPGYSQDRQFAVVRMSIPWSMWHSATATFLVSRDEGRWTVFFRQFVYHP